jgi:hypothetical protein
MTTTGGSPQARQRVPEWPGRHPLATIALELLTLAWIRWRFFSTGFVRSVVSIALGGAIIAAVSATLGAVS